MFIVHDEIHKFKKEDRIK